MTSPAPVHRAWSRRGFTLTEVVVASALGVVLLGVILSVMGTGSDGYARTTARVDANVEARAALRTLADDVASFRFDESFGIRDASTTRALNEIWFSTRMPRSAQDLNRAAGDLCFVFYYTAVTQPLEGQRGPFSRKLYRRLVSSSEVMAALKRGEDLDGPTPSPTALADEAIAFNVVQFLAVPLLRNEEGREVPWRDDDPAPTHLRITLRVTDDETAGILSEQDDWLGTTALAKELLGSGEQESGRIRTFRMTIPFSR